MDILEDLWYGNITPTEYAALKTMQITMSCLK